MNAGEGGCRRAVGDSGGSRSPDFSVTDERPRRLRVITADNDSINGDSLDPRPRWSSHRPAAKHCHIYTVTLIVYDNTNALLIVITSANAALCDRSFCLSVTVCLSVCQDYCNGNLLISLKLGVVVGHTNRKTLLTFGGDPIQDTDSGSLFHFHHHCGIVDFRFVSISHTISGRFSRHSAK